MTETNLEELRYPIGKFKYKEEEDDSKREKFISEIEEAPTNLKNAIAGLNNKQLDTPYRHGGWTVRQVVHHLPDSHLNAYVRLKLTLTEDEPTVKTYEENKWAELKDSFTTPAQVSLDLLESLHKRWTLLLKSLNENDFKKNYRHPDHGLVSLNWLLAQYAWHGKHHVAHITSLRKRMGW